MQDNSHDVAIHYRQDFLFVFQVGFCGDKVIIAQGGICLIVGHMHK